MRRLEGRSCWAAVDVDPDRLVEVRQPLLELRVEVLGVLLGLDDRELAELQARAGHGPAAEGARPHQQVVLGQAATRASTFSSGTSRMTSFCWVVVRMRPGAVLVGEVAIR